MVEKPGTLANYTQWLAKTPKAPLQELIPFTNGINLYVAAAQRILHLPQQGPLRHFNTGLASRSATFACVAPLGNITAHFIDGNRNL